MVAPLMEALREASLTPPPSSASAQRLASLLGVTRTLGEWLDRRGHSDAEAVKRFLYPRLSELTRPDQMADRALAAQRIARAIRDGERIAVFGDYDCDGMTTVQYPAAGQCDATACSAGFVAATACGMMGDFQSCDGLVPLVCAAPAAQAQGCR